MIDFEWYRSFIAVYQQRSVSNAAKIRFLTQPAVSQHLAALEAEVGEPLFVRAPRTMIPTNAGKTLYTQVVPMIEQLEVLSAEVRNQALNEQALPTIRIGAAAEFFTEMMVKKLPRDLAQYIVTFGIAEKLVHDLAERKLDVIIASKKIQMPGVIYTPLYKETFVVAAPAGLEPPEGEYENWLNEQNWLAYGLELPIIRRYYWENFSKRPQIRPKYIIPDLRAIKNAIAAGHGIGILPTYLTQNDPAIQHINPDSHATNQLYLAYLSENKDDPVIKTLLSQT